MNPILQEALRYANLGWRVFPCLPASKVPATPQGFKDATTDPEQIKAWWDHEPAYNVGLATGEVSGLFVLDVDQKQGRTIEDALASFPALPDTPTVRTGGGGLQYFFKYPHGEHLTISAGRLGLGVDTRGNGGYVVAPPSIHDRTGQAYDWIDCDETTPLAECPRFIIDRLAKQQNAAVILASEKLSGGRHDTLMTAAALMRSIGLVPAEIQAALHQMVNRLDLSDGRQIPPDEIERIARWCGDKSLGVVNIESVAHGAEAAEGLLASMGPAVREVTGHDDPQDPGPFPSAFLDVPGIVNEWMEFTNTTSKRPQPELAWIATITACGAVIGRRAEMELGGRANIYSVGLCATGGGKEAARQANKVILHEAGYDDLLGPEEFASDSGIISALVKSPVNLFQIDEFGKLLEAMKNPRAGTHLVGITSTLLKLYSSANTIYKGKAYADAERNPVIEQPHCCLYGCALSDQTWEAMGTTAAQDGLLARLWVVQAVNEKPKQVRPKRVKPPAALIHALKQWRESSTALQDMHPDPFVVPMTDEAIRVFDEFVDECDTLDRGDNPLVKLWTRAAQKAEQICMVRAWSRAPMAFVDKTAKIDEDDAIWACNVSRYLTQAMVYNGHKYLASNSLEADILAVRRYIAESKGATRTEIARKFQRLGTKGINEVMSMLESQDVIEIAEEKGSRGAPRRVVRIK